MGSNQAKQLDNQAGLSSCKDLQFKINEKNYCGINLFQGKESE